MGITIKKGRDKIFEFKLWKKNMFILKFIR